ncbi:MAG: hypothetical protein HYZ72_08450 [Deltaproteobacteria bacterium]|nr:hypothetical protein [Deltaproteobacteria bacterium]
MKVTASDTLTHTPWGETYWASGLRANLTSRSYGEGLETGRALAQVPRQSFTRQLFFRWLKGLLGCRPRLSQSQHGVQLQVYMALIASLLISLWVGRAPTKRTYELLCFYLSGWASPREGLTHVERLHLPAPPRKK